MKKRKDKRIHVFLLILITASLLLISSCTSYLGKKAVASRVGSEDYCLFNPNDIECEAYADMAGDYESISAMQSAKDEWTSGIVQRFESQLDAELAAKDEAIQESARLFYSTSTVPPPTQAFNIKPGYVETGEIASDNPASVVDSLKKQDAIKTFEIILKLPDNPNAKSLAQNNALKQTAARVIIQRLADKSGNQDGRVTPDETRTALKTMNDISGTIADKHFGNNDGKVDIQEIQTLNAAAETNPGLRAYMNLLFTYNP